MSDGTMNDMPNKTAQKSSIRRSFRLSRDRPIARMTIEFWIERLDRLSFLISHLDVDFVQI